MADRIELSISPSRDIIYAGTHFLYYIKVRNSLENPIFLEGVTYDVPKGFFLVKTKPWEEITAAQTARRSTAPPSAVADIIPSIGDWFSLQYASFKEYFDPPNFEETLLGRPRELKLNSIKILPNEAHVIVLPFQVGAHFPRMAISADTYHLEFEITFKIDTSDTSTKDTNHFQQITTDIIVYSHVGWLFIGAMAGGIVGAFLKDNRKVSPWIFMLCFPISSLEFYWV